MPTPAHVALTNSQFLRELAKAAPNGTTLWVDSFIGSPELAKGHDWSGHPYNASTMADVVDGWSQQNTYFSVACLRPDGNGVLARRKANFAGLMALVGDDVQDGDLRGTPSWSLATSPGKRQVGVFLDADDPDRADIELCTRLLAKMAEAGMIKMDPSGNNVVRYVRLPVGQNHKARHSGPFPHLVETWAPEARYSLADAAAIFGIDLDALRVEESRSSASGTGATPQDELVRSLTSNIMRGEYLHDSLVTLAASLVASGMPGGAVVNMLRGLMDSSAAPRDERFKARYADIPRCVSTAQAKFSPVVSLGLLRPAEPAEDEDEQFSTAAAASPVPAHLLSVPGVLGQAVSWINATSRKPQPMFAVQAALALASACMGRRWRTDNANWPALYFLNVGTSGAGKEHAKFAVETLLEAAGLARLIGVGRFVSESSVVSSLIDKPVQFSVLDEFGKMLQSASIAQNFADRNTLKALMETWGRTDGVLRPAAYSTAGLSSKQAEDLAKRLVRKPSLTLLAMTTPETLFDGLSSAAVADGFLSRFITVHSDRGRQLARTVEAVEPPAELLAWMREISIASASGGNLAGLQVAHDMDPDPAVVPIDAGALRVFSELERIVLERSNQLDAEGLAEMLTRRTEMAMRLALIVACSCGHSMMLRQDAEWACEYVMTHAERDLSMLRERLSDGIFDKLCKEVERLVRAAGAHGMTERDLNKASRSWRSNPLRMREDALRSLERRGAILYTEVPNPGGRGRKRFAWVTPGHAPNKSPTNADKTPTDAPPQ